LENDLYLLPRKGIVGKNSYVFEGRMIHGRLEWGIAF
jgi:hypothetical protein